jgi:uncharacterized protein with HEPN domain
MQPDSAKRDAAAVIDILIACRKIAAFAGEKELTELGTDELIQSAVLYQLLVVGEAAKRLSRSCSAQHPEIPWSQMARMRDRLIHGYDVVRMDVVWAVVRVELPPVVERLRAMLKELGFDEPT